MILICRECGDDFIVEDDLCDECAETFVSTCRHTGYDTCERCIVRTWPGMAMFKDES